MTERIEEAEITLVTKGVDIPENLTNPCSPWSCAPTVCVPLSNPCIPGCIPACTPALVPPSPKPEPKPGNITAESKSK